MPTYAYACTECEHRFEIVQSFVDDSLTDCPECAGRLRKLFNAVGVVFKGSGFYRTDSRNDLRKGQGPVTRSASSSEAGSSSSDSSSDSSKGSTSSDSSSSGGTTKTAAKTDGSKTDGSRTDGSRTTSKVPGSAA